MNDLQRITDQMASDLDRAVYLEDAAFRPLASSAQLGHIDDARVEALLSRRPTEAHLQYFLECGVPDARTTVRVPSSKRHDLLARVVVPVLVGDRVLARVWLIDSQPPVRESEITRVHEAAAELGPHLVEKSAQNRRGVEIGERLMRGMHQAGRKRREGLFGDLCDHYGIDDPRDARVCVVPLAVRPSDGERPVENVDHARVDDLLGSFVDLLDVHRAAGHVHGTQLCAVVAPRTIGETTLDLVTSAARRSAAFHGLAVGAVGVGGTLREADDLEQSFRQAAFAASVAARVTAYGAGACWDDLGEYRLFADLEWGLAGVASLHRGVAALVADARRPLASTLLAYLERDGDVDQMAQALNVHRTTLYYRIRQAEEVLGESATGQAGLAVHAALRFADLVGLCVPPRSQ